MITKHFDNYDFIQNHEQYVRELEILNEALENIKDKIKTWSGKLLYDEHKHTIEVLLKLNKGE